MQPVSLWFNVIPAIACAIVALIAFVAFARFVPDAVRRRDWKMTAALAYSYLLFGGFLFVSIRTIMAPIA